MKKTLQMLRSGGSGFLTSCLLGLALASAWTADAQTTVQVGSGTGYSEVVPIYAFYGYSYSQSIYTAAEITAGGGTAGGAISKIRYFRNSASTGNITNSNSWTVYIGNTAVAAYASNTSWIPTTQMTQVFSGNVTFPAAGNWMEITLATPFVWNGTDNLVVAVDENTASWSGAAANGRWGNTSLTQNRTIYYYDDNNNPNPASPPTAVSTLQSIPNIQFVFLPACAGAPTPGNTLASAAAVCAGQSSNLSIQNAQNFSGITYQWQSFDGTNWNNINGATGTTYAAANLTATTQFRCRVACGVDESFSTPVTVTVNALPNVSVTPVSAISCAAEAVTLTASGADTYVWSPATGLSGTTGASVTATPAAAQTYTVTGTVTATTCTNTATVTVSPIATFVPNVVSSPVQVCNTGSPVTLSVNNATGSLPAGAQVEYQWLDSAGTGVLQDWSTAGYTFTPTTVGTKYFNVKARLSTCPATVTATQAYSVTVGLSGNVTVNDIYCGQTAGSLVVTNAFGPLATMTWYENNFASATLNPAQAQLFGTGASITGGRLVLTPNTGSVSGAMQINNPAGINPASLQIDFDLTVGGGPSNTNGADGLSFSFGPDVVPIPTATNAENGSGTALKIAFDAYGSGTTDAPAGIYLMYNCTVLNQATNSPGVLQYVNNLSWKGATNHVTISISAQGRVTMKLGNTTIFNNVQLPAAYLNANKSTWKHVFSARTGGVSENHEIDNLKIQYFGPNLKYGVAATGNMPTSWQTSNTLGNLSQGTYDVYIASATDTAGCNKLLGTYTIGDGLTPAPGNTIASTATVCANTNTAVTLTLQNSYAAYTGITWQWQRFDGTNWNDLPNDTLSTYSFTGLAQTTQFRCNVTCNGSLTGTSTPVTVTSVAPPTVSVTPAAVTICTGELPTLTASGADTYTWTPNTDLSSGTGSTVQASPTAFRTYTITGTTTATGCSNTATAYATPMQFLPITTSLNPSQSCTAGSPITMDVTSIPDYVAGFGTLEFQWLDSLDQVIQDWSATSSYTFTPATEGYYAYTVKMRSTGCADEPAPKRVEFYVGFGGEVATTDINCHVPFGTIQISDAFGQGQGGLWYGNNFDSNVLNATEATLHQNAAITGGRLVLTPSATSNRGGFTVLNPTGIQGTDVQYDITFNMTADQPINVFGTGGGDGIAYSFGPDANYTNFGGNPCSGFGSKLRISFDAANNGTENANTFGIYLSYGYGGTTQIGPFLPTTLGYSTDTSLWKGDADVPVSIRIEANGKLTLRVNNTVVFNQVQLPAEFVTADKTTWKHVFSAQTGGDALRQAIDGLNIRYSALNFGLAAGGSGNLPNAWQNSPTFNGLTAGSYDVYVSNVDDSLCNKLLGTYTIIDKNPHVDFPADTVLCAGSTIILDAGNPGSYYEWSPGGQQGTDEQFLTVTQQGTYIVEVTDTFGCDAVGIISVTGSDLPVVHLGNDTSICAGNTLTLDAGTDGTDYLWNNSTTNQTLAVTTAGNYSVTVTNAQGCSSSDAIAVTVLQAASVAGIGTSISGNSVTFTSQTPQNVTNYAWSFGDGNTITNVSPSILYNYAHCGTYNITLTVSNANNCGTDVANTSVTLECTGIDESDLTGGLGVYPNPASDYINLSNPNDLTIEGISVFDASGKQVYRTAGTQVAMPDITTWSAGMYLIKVEANGKTFTQRFIIGR